MPTRVNKDCRPTEMFSRGKLLAELGQKKYNSSYKAITPTPAKTSACNPLHSDDSEQSGNPHISAAPTPAATSTSTAASASKKRCEFYCYGCQSICGIFCLAKISGKHYRCAFRVIMLMLSCYVRFTVSSKLRSTRLIVWPKNLPAEIA